ncbi:MAG: Gfo/Idh/MocA family oxidoreductase [Firmicutes bacterium]|nr:Gfo/Idh/MocA family oxidoreductase [Bacillota bacterium]
MKLKVCIIGQSGHLNHVTSRFSSSCGFEITGAALGPEGGDCQSAFEKIRGLNNLKIFSDYLTMLDELKPDIAVVAPYCSYNSQVSIECFKRKIHVFSEKPASTTLEGLKALKDAYSKSGVVYTTMMAMRHSVNFAAAKHAVASGRVGKIKLINLQKSYKLGNRGGMYRKRELYGGIIPWVGSHVIDLAYWICGERFKSAAAFCSSEAINGIDNMETAASCLFTTTNGIIITASLDYLRPAAEATHGDDRIRIVGSKGIVEVKGGKAHILCDEGEQFLPALEKSYIFDEFLKAVKGRENTLPHAKDSFYVSEVSLKARDAADNGEIILLK